MALSAYTKVLLAISALAAVQAAVIQDVPVEGYRLLGSPPSANWTIAFVQKQGYTLEVHNVTTKDGYILSLYRIPGNKALSNKGGPPVLLHHGFMGCAADWVVLGPQKALGFILADKGFDVWLANARGSTYSRNHTKLPTWRKAFWDFSFHEIGTEDIPAEIDYILKNTGRRSLSFVGFSMGTTAFLSLATTNPAYVQKVNRFVALGPVAYMKHVQGPALKWVAPLTAKASTMVTLFGGSGEFMPTNKFTTWAAKKFCKDDKLSQKLCSNVLFMLFGFNSDKVNSTLVEQIFEFSPAGGSLKTLIHFGQLVQSAPTFRQFDLGKVRNLVAYGTLHPPAYNLSTVHLPVHVFLAENDWFANKIDVYRLVSELPNVKTIKLLPRQNFNHFDFVYAGDAVELFYNDVVQILEADKTPVPPVTQPPVTQPPVTKAPVTNPPVTQPPVTQPPVTQPPVTKAPVTNPPVTNPPVTNPPVTNPPATKAPVPVPPVTNRP